MEIEASKLKKNSAAILFLWENLWLDGVRKAIVGAGESLAERGQISAEVVKQFEKELERDKRKASAKTAAAAKKRAAAKKKTAAKNAAAKKKK